MTYSLKMCLHCTSFVGLWNEVFPYKSPNARILRDSLGFAIFLYVSGWWTANGYIIDVWLGYVGNIGLKDMRYIIVKNRDRVRPSHRQGCESHCAIRSLKRGKIARTCSECAFVISYV